MPEQLPASALTLRRVPITHPDAQRLIADVQAEYAQRYGSGDESPVVPEGFDGERGSFFVGYVGDEAVTTGAWRVGLVEALGTTRTAEIKRMYVVQGWRGRGLARLVLAHLEATAAAFGIEALVLGTGTLQPEAIALYESSGYVPVPGFGHYRESPLSRCFGKRLS